jgi:CheY-like chemotaxis protein
LVLLYKSTNVQIDIRFKHMIEEQKDIHIKIPKELYIKLKVKCAYNSSSMQDYIIRLMNQDIESPSGRKKSVLIVDDEKVMRESLRDWLKDSYDVTTAETGEETMEMVKDRDFDALILDVRLTGKSGIDVLKEVKQIKPHINCIVMTAYPSVELAVEAMKAGAIEFIVKPFSPVQLERFI